MTTPRSAPASTTWAAPYCPFVVDCGLGILEDIGREVMDACETRSGEETGGLLLGVYDGGRVRIEGFEPILCGHASGLMFKLSRDDERALVLQIERHRGDGPKVVGWYHSHTMSALELSDEDVRVFEAHFPEPWQVSLLMRPDGNASVPACFYFRHSVPGDGRRVARSAPFSVGVTVWKDRRAAARWTERTIEARASLAPRRPGTNGKVHAWPAAESVPEPVVEKVPATELAAPSLPARKELPATPEPAPSKVTVAPAVSPPVEAAAVPASAVPASAVATRPEAEMPAVNLFRAAPARRHSRALWAVAALLALGIASAVVFRFSVRQPARTADFLLVEATYRDGVLDVAWDTTALGDSRTAKMEIRDGPVSRRITLDRTALLSGHFQWQPSSDLTAFRLSVDRPSGSSMEGSATVIGPPRAAIPAAARAEAPAFQSERVKRDEPPAAAQAPPSVEAVKGVAEPAKPIRVAKQTEPPKATAPAGITQSNGVDRAKVRSAPPPVHEEPKSVEPPERKPDPSPPPAPEPATVQTAQAQREPVLDRPPVPQAAPQQNIPVPNQTSASQAAAATAPKPVVTQPPATLQARAPVAALSGRWQLQKGGFSRSPAVPEALSLTISDVDGNIRGTLEARYRSGSKTERLSLSFFGKPTGAGARCGWVSSDNRHGELELIRAPNSPDMVEVVWRGVTDTRVYDEVLKRVQ